MVIHRLTGDGPRSLLIAPLWSTDKKRVLERQYPIHKELVDACREKNKEKICHVLSEHYMRTIRRLLKEQGLSEEDSGFSFDFLV